MNRLLCALVLSLLLACAGCALTLEDLRSGEYSGQVTETWEQKSADEGGAPTWWLLYSGYEGGNKEVEITREAFDVLRPGDRLPLE
tara:strand:+ start:52 stop:309 length:258 start_codon:yes stop_codon:yes gene_type:complete